MLEWFKCYIEDTFNTDSNTAATIVITLFVFALGYLFSFVSKVISGLISRCRIRRLVKGQMLSLHDDVKTQSEFFTEFSAKLDLSKSENLMLKNVSMPDLTNYQNIEFEKVYQSYNTGIENILNSRKKLYDELIRLTGGLLYVKERYQIIFKDFSDANNRFNEKWSVHIEELRRLFDKISVEIHTNRDLTPNQSEYGRELNNIILSYQEMNDNSKENTFNNLVEPLIELNQRFGRRLPQYSLPMIDILSECRYDFRNIEFLFRDYRTVFNEYTNSYKKIYRKLRIIGK